MPVPAAPVITAADEGVGGSLATITTVWGVVAGATSYKFFYGQDVPATTDLDDAAVSPYPAGFDTLHTWHLRVKAHNASGDSAYSNEVQVKPGAKPSAPVLAAVLDGDDAATLTWPYVGNEDVNAYAVYRGLAANPTDLLENTLPAAPYEDTGLDAGTTYHYRVTATNLHGESAYSNDVTITTPAAIDAPVTLVAVRNQGNLTMRLTIDKVVPPDDYVLVDYQVLIDGAVATAFADPDVPQDGVPDATRRPDDRLSYIVLGLAYDTAYDVSVRALLQTGIEDPRAAVPGNTIRLIVEDEPNTEAPTQALRHARHTI